MVPSWTETLLEAGVEVVGRTRFCIHAPSGIPRVGGTKDWKLSKLLALKPDLLVLDREENPQFMAEDSGLPVWASHVRSIDDLAPQLRELAEVARCPRLLDYAARWQNVAQSCLRGNDWPGVVEWGRRPSGPVDSVVYVIWRDPWMAVGPETFIGSVLRKVGYRVYPFAEKYPSLTEFPLNSLLLFSSEPFPFLRKRQGLEELGLPYAFVNGESFSWFGVRTLRFLELQAAGGSGPI